MRDLKGKTILLVEDEAIIAAVEEHQLENAGCEVVLAGTGEAAVEMVRSGKWAFDLVLMDIDLGRGMDGAAAAREILRDRDIPVLFLSCHTEKEVVEKTEEITSYGYVVKNSDFAVLDASMKMAFKLFAEKMRVAEHQQLLEKAIEARDEESALRRALFEQSPDGILLIDPATAGFLDFNATAHRQLGYSREEFAKLRIFDVETVESVEETQERIATVIRKGKVDFETRQRTKQGEIRDVRVIAQYLVAQGRPAYYCVWRDITENNRTLAALNERMVELEQFNRLMVGRENRMIELKQEVNALRQVLNLPPKYPAPQ